MVCPGQSGSVRSTKNPFFVILMTSALYFCFFSSSRLETREGCNARGPQEVARVLFLPLGHLVPRFHSLFILRALYSRLIFHRPMEYSYRLDFWPSLCLFTNGFFGEISQFFWCHFDGLCRFYATLFPKHTHAPMHTCCNISVSSSCLHSMQVLRIKCKRTIDQIEGEKETI